MTHAVNEQLQETLFELKRVEERKNKYKEENSAILSAISAMSGATNKIQVFNILLEVIGHYVKFDNALVLTRNSINEREHTCLVATTDEINQFQWHHGDVFQRCVTGKTVVLYAPDRVSEFSALNADEKGMCQSALISGMTVNANESLLILLGNQKGLFDPKIKQVIERFRPLIERTIIDIDYRARLQSLVDVKTQELYESRQQFRDFAKTASDWFWELNENNEFSYLSSPGIMNIDIESDDIFRQIEEQPEIHQKLLDNIKHQLPFSDVELTINRNGQEQWISLSGLPFYDKDKNWLGYRGTAKDISRKNAVFTNCNLLRNKPKVQILLNHNFSP